MVKKRPKSDPFGRDRTSGLSRTASKKESAKQKPKARKIIKKPKNKGK